MRRLRGAGEPVRNDSEGQKAAYLAGRPKMRYWKGKRQPRKAVEQRAAKIRGENHWLWKGGKERRPYRKVKEKVACEACGGKLNLGFHHKDFDHYNDAPENLQILCLPCHLSLHKKAYWKAKKEGGELKKSNGPVGWRRSPRHA